MRPGRPRPLLAVSVAVTALVTAGCGRLDELAYTPATTPQEWCQQRPCFDVGGTVVSEPLGTALVVLLALAWLGAGAYFLVTASGQRSRLWLGVALVLGGVGAAMAGASYQAFSYPLKCEGWDYCRLTDGLEVGYSVAQATSVSAMVVAVAYACTRLRARRWLVLYAVANVVAYLAVTAVGVMLPSAALLSFEVLMLFAVPGIVIVIVVGARCARQADRPLGRRLVVAAVLLVAVQVAYFAWYASGLTAALWDDGAGFYFSANEVLHVGMLGCLVYVVVALRSRLRDLPSGG